MTTTDNLAVHPNPDPRTPQEEVVLDLIATTFQAGRVREGVERCIAEDYTQHNPRVADGREAVIGFFDDLRARFPDFTYEIRHLVSDGDLVCIHAYSRLDDERESALFDLFRLADGLIVEHWDAIQEIPAGSANPHPMF